MSLIPKNLYGEEYAEDVAFLLKPNKVLGEVKSKYQTSTIIETKKFGRVILQDDLIYLADSGNEAIAEIYTHVPMLTGPEKRNVLLIGAGDGAGVQRFLDYPSLERIVGIDIDSDFVELCKKVMLDKTISFKDKRVEFIIQDGAQYLQQSTEKFDLIVCTVGDPYTISSGLFTDSFMEKCSNHLVEDGIVSMDGYMPYYTHHDSLNYWDIFELVAKHFPITRIAISTSPLMPGGLCTFIFGSKKHDPMNKPRKDLPVKTVWYNYKLHQASFVLPEFVREKLIGLKGFKQ